MAKPKVPSVQHLARNWQDTPERTCKTLVRLVNNPPTFNYNALFLAARDMLVFNQPYDEIVEGIKRAVKRADVRKNFLEVLPLIRDHFADVTPDFVQSIDRRYYSIGRGLMVPFDPPLLYGVGGQLTFPWFSFWRQNPLARERLSLFVTLVDELLADDPDLAAAKFQILDFSVPRVKGREPLRELRVIEAGDIPRVSEDRKIEMLRVFADGYFMAEAELARRPAAPSEERERPDPRQGDFFDKDPPNP
ncbi:MULTISPECIES: hypothetical protein [unclassified Bradyrhizobium]|uniref:hypothetical protein n=1 Tax=unclassified Bradyrhizobium TaxID=2631580 RepID=UPI002916F597|nr:MULTISPECIES: hypothetical protein [unclassified Bradyrhizobium]